MEILVQTQERAYAIRFSAQEIGVEMGHVYLYIIYNDLHEEPYGLMEDVFVEESVRGSGVGTQLVGELIAKAIELGCRKLIAQSRYGKDKVHDWYMGLGFSDHGKNFRMDFID